MRILEAEAEEAGDIQDLTDFHRRVFRKQFFEDIFEEVFTGGRGGSASANGGRARGQDLRYDVEISMEDAYSGTKITAKVPKLTECDACNGYGTHDGNRPAKCGACNGMGKPESSKVFFTMERPCGECNGSGERQQKNAVNVMEKE